MTINSELNFPQVLDTNFCPEKLYGPLVNVPFPAAKKYPIFAAKNLERNRKIPEEGPKSVD
jgi:hypothetical protein